MSPSTARLVDRSVLLAATLILVAHQYSFPSQRFWVASGLDSDFTSMALLALIATFGTFTPFQSWAERSQVVHRTAVRHQVLSHFGRLLALAVRAQPSIAPTDLGLHIWTIRRSWWTRPFQRLVRLATYKLGTTPATRSFEPAKGVGVVGLCWKRNEEVAVNVAALAELLRTQEQYDSYRNNKGEDAVMGLSWVDFERIRHRGAVFASPIRDSRGEFIGCVSVDASRSFESLSGDELWHEINSLCLVLGHDGLRHV
ncbi:MAG TPA: hypothetical protein VFC19_10370 [Candidatus Limnocylindrales bacterium]|nr:hypothetical protein [Candidatus Limnocylindrales bacterium]